LREADYIRWLAAVQRKPAAGEQIERPLRTTMPHRIRLRGPWEFEPLWQWVRGEHGSWQQNQADLPPGGTFTAPRRWSDVLGPDFRGCVRLTRRFHRPTGLETESKLWLVVGDLIWPTEIRLGERSIAWINPGGDAGDSPSKEPARVEIERIVASENKLTALVTAPPISAGHGTTISEASASPLDWLGQVWLEIE
jgi:hypothetical protein